MWVSISSLQKLLREDKMRLNFVVNLRVRCRHQLHFPISTQAHCLIAHLVV